MQFPVGWQARQGQFHQQFGLGSRDQGIRRDCQVHRPEPALPTQIGHRLTALATRQQGLEAGRGAGFDCIAAVGEQPAAGLAQHVPRSRPGLARIDPPAAASSRLRTVGSSGIGHRGHRSGCTSAVRRRDQK